MIERKFRQGISFIFIIIFIIIFIFNVCGYSARAVSKVDSKENIAILVDITEEKPYLIDKDKNVIVKKYSIASGKRETPSPTGTWKVVNTSKWSGAFGTDGLV